MPRIPRKPTARVSTYFPPDTHNELVARSKENHRSLNSEVVNCVERFLATEQTKKKVTA